MDSEPRAAIPTQFPASPPAAQPTKLLAPVWHTILIIVIMVVNSYYTAKFLHISGTTLASSRIWDYVFTIGFEFFLLLLVWFGLWMKKYSMRELIGGKWSRPEDFLIDVGIAIGFWLVSLLILAGLAYLLGQMNEASVNEMK